MNDYAIWLKDPTGQALAVLDRYGSCRAAYVTGGVGTLALSLPYDAYPASYFQPDSIIEIWRTVDDAPPALLGDKVFFVRSFERGLSPDGQRTLDIAGECCNSILARHIVAYPSTSASASGSAAGDDLCKDIVTANYGASASDYNSGTGRDLSAYLSVQSDLTAGPLVEKAFANKTVLGVLQEICRTCYQLGTYVTFDIVSTCPASGIGLEFRTYTGQRGIDRRFPGGANPIILDPEQGAISELARRDDYSRVVNYIYAAGKGTLVGSATDATSTGAGPFHRVEKYISGFNSSSTAQLDDEAAAELRKYRVQRTYSARLADTPGLRFGRDYGLGDYLTVQDDGDSFDARLDAVAAQLSASEERLDCVLRGDA